MIFNSHQFSKRFPPVICSIFVVHEPDMWNEPYIKYDPKFERPYEVIRFAQYRATAAAIILEDGRFWIGVSLCSPNDDFVKKIGRAKAVGRAYQLMRAGQDGTEYLYEDGEVEFSNNSDSARLVGEDWTGRLKARLQTEINETKRKMQYGPLRTK